MQTKPDDIDVILPYGEALRAFLEQPFITKADLKAILRSRGVFVGQSEKADTIPILVCSLLSPREFDRLRELQTSREDNPKRNSRFLDWHSDKPLIDCIPEKLNLHDLIKDDFVNYSVLGSPTFVVIGNSGSHVRLDFEIERRDLSKSWCISKQKFKGSIELQRVEGQVVKFLITHTAQETKALSQRVTKQLTSHFRTQRFMPSAGGILQILFGDFTNAERAQFFASLTGDLKHDWFKFDKITDYNIRPDPGSTPPRELQLFMKGVNELKVKGNKLQEHLFIKNKQYHPHLLFLGMEARFKFAVDNARGLCAVSYDFTGFEPKDPSECEFEINISQLSIESERGHANKPGIKERLLGAIDTYMHSQYKRITAKESSLPQTEKAEIGISPGLVQQSLPI